MKSINCNYIEIVKTKLKKFRKFNALNQLDKKMLNYINFSDGFYIECGANDGVNQSNTWYLEKYLNWKGILIEPLREKFKELKKNRSNKNFFYNVALSSPNNKKVFIENNGLMSKVINKIDKRTKLTETKCKTLTAILDQAFAPNLIDFFSLDVEGHEDKVIEGINFKKYNFKFFLVETKKKNVTQFLKENNYKLIKKMSYHDYLFKYKNSI